VDRVDRNRGLVETASSTSRRLVAWAVLNHAAALGAHYVTHWGAHVSQTGEATAYVWLVMAIGPCAGLWLIAADRERAGTMVVTAGFAGGLAFSGLQHFVAIGADHVGAVAPGTWQRLFRSTVWFLAVTQVVGVAIGMQRLLRLRRGIGP
jgi:hypothetical protein